MNPFSIAHDDLWQYMKKSCANTESTQVRQIREHKHAISNEHLVESEHTKALLDSRTGLLLCQQCSTGLRNIFSFLQQHCYRKLAGTAYQAAIIIPVRPLPPLLDGTVLSQIRARGFKSQCVRMIRICAGCTRLPSRQSYNHRPSYNESTITET